ncbi:MAG TPA: AraC family transcriptional regulator ligand-binding domain-containing protein [Caulobacteraceae bacterium]
MPEAIEPRPLTAGYFRLILRRFGDTPAARAAILEGTGIGEDEINDNTLVSITFAQQIQQFENVERLHGEGWALIAPDVWRPMGNHPRSVAVISARTVGAALEIMAKYISANAPNQRLKLVRGSTSVSLRHSVAAELPPNHWRTMVEAVYLRAGSALGALLGHALEAVRFEFMWPEPSYGPRLQEALGGQMRWNAPANAIVIPKRLLALRSPLADAVVHQHALEQLEQVSAFAGAPTGAKDRVEQLLARSDTGRLSLPQVARSLGLSQRTLNRRLADAEVSYRGLTDAELKARAQRMLEAGALSKGAIGERLGFADAAGFSRACRRWFKAET